MVIFIVVNSAQVHRCSLTTANELCSTMFDNHKVSEFFLNFEQYYMFCNK